MPGSGGSDPSDASSHSEERLRVADLAFVVGVPLALVAVFALPAPVRRDLALSYARPSVLTMYTSHFVHLEASYLLSNVAVFLAVVPFALVTSVRSGRRRRFYLVAFTLLTVFPFALSVLNVAFPRPRIGMGFSGINLAFAGYLPHALSDRFEAGRGESLSTRRTLLPALFFLGTTVVVCRMALAGGAAFDTGRWLLAAGGGSLLAVTLCVGPVVRERPLARPTGERTPPVVLFGTALFVLVLVAGFPSSVRTGDSVINVFLHFLGYSLGYIVPYVAFEVLGIDVD